MGRSPRFFVALTIAWWKRQKTGSGKSVDFKVYSVMYKYRRGSSTPKFAVWNRQSMEYLWSYSEVSPGIKTRLWLKAGCDFAETRCTELVLKNYQAPHGVIQQLYFILYYRACTKLTLGIKIFALVTVNTNFAEVEHSGPFCIGLL